MELEWMKKKLPPLAELKRPLIDVVQPELSIRRQCELLGLNRSSFYYEPAGETPEDLRLMRLLDEQYTACPFYGGRRITAWLIQAGERVNRKRVQRLMRLMGLEAIYPKPRLSLAGRGHRIYPHLLRGVTIERLDQVWSADITERLWRAVKYEDIYIEGYEEVPELRRGLARYFAFYNHARLHQAMSYRIPAAVYAMPVPGDLRLSLPARGG
jgi:hypothetical protein